MAGWSADVLLTAADSACSTQAELSLRKGSAAAGRVELWDATSSPSAVSHLRKGGVVVVPAVLLRSCMLFFVGLS